MTFDLVKNSPKYLAWKELAENQGAVLHGVKTLAAVPRFHSEDLLFAFLHLDAESRDGHKLHHYLLIRGHAVIILPVLIDAGSGDRYTVLVRQLRTATGGPLFELPAGMTDTRQDRPLEVAYQEFHEEVGLDLDGVDLVPMNKEPLYTSPGLLDEGIYYFYVEKTLPLETIRALDGTVTGCASELEHITLHVVPFEEAFSMVQSIPSLFALYWYKQNV